MIPKKYRWIVSSILFSIFMFVSMQIVFPKMNNQPIDYSDMPSKALLYSLLGLAYGLILRFIYERKKPADNE
jgi:membrane protease YdiL (CAAX protease family)